MRNLILVIAFLSIGLSLSAQKGYMKTVVQTEELSKEVTNLFAEGDVTGGIKKLERHWPLPKNELASLEEKTIKYMNMLDLRFGKIIGFEKVKNEKINSFAIRETYIIRYEYSAIRLMFTYYENDKGWLLNSFKWDDSFTEEFK
jgi:hypothetical protein